MSRLILTFIFSLSLFSLLSFGFTSKYNSSSLGKSNVYAEYEEDEDDEDAHEEDEDDEDEHEEDDDDEYEDRTQETIYEYVIYEGEEIPDMYADTVPVVTDVIVVDVGYNIDSDGDDLVDALDPNPNINEKLLFTDSDEDGVPDATDAYPGEDDFLYLLFEDSNSNGISDFLEF